jgi:CheY-like chemotaxis protein
MIRGSNPDLGTLGASTVAPDNRAPDSSSEPFILVVDDWEGIRDIAQAALEAEGYAVRTVASGEEALEVLRSDRLAVAAVVLDLGLPGMSGQDTYRALRDLHPDLPVVLMSGDAQGAASPAIAGDAGPHVFLAKPFAPADLRRTVTAILG